MCCINFLVLHFQFYIIFIILCYFRPAQLEFKKRIAKEIKATLRLTVKLSEKNAATREKFLKSAAEKLQKLKQIDQKLVKATQEKMAVLNDTKVGALQSELDLLMAKTFEKQCVGQDIFSQESNYLVKVLTEPAVGGSKVASSTKFSAEDVNNRDNYDLNKLILYFED